MRFINYKLNIIQKLMSIKIVLSIFFLFSIALCACTNPNDPTGKCTACTPNDILISGICYPKMRGCMKYAQGPACVQCQNGYVLTNRVCIRQGQYYNRTNLSYIPPVYIQPLLTLTLDDIRNKLGEKYGEYFTEAHEYFLAKYQQLGKPNIKNVDKLKTKKGDFLIIEYQTYNSTRYQAVSFISNPTTGESGNVKELSFGPMGKFKNDPITIQRLLRFSISNRMKDNFIYQFKIDNDYYTIDYMNSENQVTRVQANKTQLFNPKSIAKLSTKSLSLSQLGKQYIQTIYPWVSNLPLNEYKNFGQYHVLKLGTNVYVSFKFENYIFSTNIPINTTNEVVGGVVVPIALEAYTNLTDYSSKAFKDVVDWMVLEVPEVIGAVIVRLQVKNYNGTIYLFNMRKPSDEQRGYEQYQIKIWSPASASSTQSLILLKKDNKVIYTTSYNYNLDQYFFSHYNAAVQASKVGNIPPIFSVTFKKMSGKDFYRVVYGPNEYMNFQYFYQTEDDEGSVNLLTYVAAGDNVLTIFNKHKKSPSQILLFIKKNTQLGNQVKLKQFTYNPPTYVVATVSKIGTYRLTFQQSSQAQSDTLSLTDSEQISPQTCFELTESTPMGSPSTNQQLKIINQFVKSSYELEKFNLQLVQINVLDDYSIYRLLYANTGIKQAEFFVKEVGETANVIKASFINSGYQVVDMTADNSDYRTMIAAVNKSSGKEKLPFFMESNSSSIKGCFVDGNNILQIVYDKPTKKLSPQPLPIQYPLLVPQGFSLQTLLVPANPPNQQIVMLAKIYQQVLKKYPLVSKDSSLMFADKRDSTYNLMYKNHFGYQKLEVKIDEKGGIVVGRLLITGYKESDFSNCKRFNRDGKCLSCQIGGEVEFQGVCYKKIEGCLIQAGQFCIKCNAKYVKSAYKCFRDCQTFFK